MYTEFEHHILLGQCFCAVMTPKAIDGLFCWLWSSMSQSITVGVRLTHKLSARRSALWVMSQRSYFTSAVAYDCHCRCTRAMSNVPRPSLDRV